MKYIASKYLRRHIVSHLARLHEGVLTGTATFLVCSRCGAEEAQGCNCPPSQFRLPNDQLLAQFINKLAKKRVKLVGER